MSTTTKNHRGTAIAIIALLFGAWVFYQNSDIGGTDEPELRENERVVRFSWTTRIEREANITWSIGSTGETRTNHQDVAWRHETVARVGDYTALSVRTSKSGYGECRIEVNGKTVAQQKGRLWACGINYTVKATD